VCGLDGLIQAAVSRQREFLADASSVQFTRNPAGIAGALKKIGGLSYGSKLEAAHAARLHTCTLAMAWRIAVRAHGYPPPLEERIGRLTRTSTETFPPVRGDVSDDAVADILSKRLRPGAGPADSVPFPFPLPGMPTPRRAWPDLRRLSSLRMRCCGPWHSHNRAPALRRSSCAIHSARVQNAARDPLGASALIYALLLSSEPETRAKQLQLLARRASGNVAAAAANGIHSTHAKFAAG